jgi:hypothetical protein
VNDIDALVAASRLQELGIEVRSPSLKAKAEEMRDFRVRGGNRAMRRAAARSKRKTP